MTPRAALQPCPAAGCPKLTSGGPCETHKRERQQRRERTRDPEQRRFYGSTRWKRLREHVRRTQPLCELCQEEGRVTPGTTVDHRDGNWRRNDLSNLRNLCRPCERSRTGRQHAAKANGAR